MVDQVQNIGNLGSTGFVGVTSRKMGFLAKFKDNQPNPATPGATPTTDFEQWIEAIACINRSGGLLLPGKRCLFDDATSYEGPYRAVSGYAGADQRGDGVVPWTCPTLGVPNGEVFYLIRKGPAKLMFDGVDVAIAIGDLIGASAAGEVAKFGSGVTLANSAAHTNTTDAADVLTKSIPANRLKKYQTFRIIGAGHCPATNSTDTLTVLLTFAGQTVGSTGAIDVADNDAFFVDVVGVVRSTGATGSILLTGTISLKGTTIAISKVLTVDTTAAITVAINADWSAQSTSDQFVATLLDVNLGDASGDFARPFARAVEAVASNAADDTLFKCIVDFTQIG